MKFVWNVNFVEGYENSHTIIRANEETEIIADSTEFTVKIVSDDKHDITDEVNFVYYVDGIETVFSKGDTTNPCISGNFPDGVSILKVQDGRYKFSGKLPIVNGEKTFYFTLRARVDITESLLEKLSDEERNNLEGKEFIYDDYFMSIIVKNKDLVILSDSEYEFIETIYTKHQIELLNSEGNEEFVKTDGILPGGITLSSGGLLYGIAHDDNNDFGENVSPELRTCKIAIRRNGEIIKDRTGKELTTTFTSRVKKLSEQNDPIWITDSGQIASLNYNEQASQSLFVKAYDPKNRNIRYEVVQGYKLPDGLELIKSNGHIEGKCKTKETKIWNVKISASNGVSSVERMFSIETNKVGADRFIRWKTNTNLGSHKIGDNIFLKIEAESNYNITYSLVSNTLPKGLTFSNGLIYGKIKYQDLKRYNIIIEATNGYDTIQNKFFMTLEKGLGKNAVNCYFYINHEYDDDYAEMLSYFSRSNAYEPRNELYRIKSTPQIDICECKCFDKELMSYLLEFNDSLDITWGNTIRKDVFNGDKILYTTFYKDIQEQLPTGGIQSWGGDKIYVTYNRESPSGYYLEGTTTPAYPTNDVHTDTETVIKGKPYIIYKGQKIYIKMLSPIDYYINETKELIDVNEPKYIEEYQEYNEYTFVYDTKYRKYVLRNGEKKYITQCEENMIGDLEANTYTGLYLTDEIVVEYEKDMPRHYYIDNKKTTMYMPSTNEIRKALSTEINVVKSDNEHIFYDPGSQEIISEDDFEHRYTLYYDNLKESYYVVYDGEPVYMDVYATNYGGRTTQAYAWVENNKWMEGIDNKTASQTTFDDTWDNRYADTTEFVREIDGNEMKYELKPLKVLVEQLNTDVDYQSYLIFEKGTLNLQENILFTLSWSPYTSFIILDGVPHIVKEISKPWIYEPELNEHVGFNKRIVLPYISDEDVVDTIVRGRVNGKHINFFDAENETIPEWKARVIKEYAANTYYYPGDIFSIKIDDKPYYYQVTKTFKSGNDNTTYDEEYVTILSDSDVENLLKSYYFPALPLFFAKPYTEYGEKGSVLPSGMEADEASGKLLTGRKFCFFEVHFSPLYNNNIDNFTIDFYNHNNDRSPEFQLI